MENNNMENTEASWRPNPIFFFIALGMVALVMFGIAMAVNASGAKNAPAETTTVATTESIPETTTDILPETEETIHTELTETVPEVTEPPVTEPAVAPNGMTDLELLACVIYQEAGSDKICDDCRRRVADVVLNRVASTAFPDQDTIYDVLMRQGQYGRFHWTGVKWPDRASSPNEQHAVERAYRIAEEVLHGNHSELYEEGYVWQAEFKQGKDIIYCCGIYFGRLK